MKNKQSKLTNPDLLGRFKQTNDRYFVYRFVPKTRIGDVLYPEVINYHEVTRYYPVENDLGLDLIVYKDQMWVVIEALTGMTISHYCKTRREAIEDFRAMTASQHMSEGLLFQRIHDKVKEVGTTPRYINIEKQP